MVKQDNRCSAICLVHDVFALDYPLSPGVDFGPTFSDEVVFIVPRCSDDTLFWARGLANNYPGRYKVVEAPTLPMDHKVPQRVWELGAEVASYPWLCQWDLAWGLPKLYGPWIKDAMSMPSVKLASFAIHELYGTPRWYVQSPVYRKAILGHRSVDFRIETVEPPPLVGRSWKTRADMPTSLGGLHTIDADHWVGRQKAILEVAVIDFSRARKPAAVAASQVLNEMMMNDVASFADWHLPTEDTYEPDIQARVRSGMVAPYDHGEIPETFQSWCDAHREEWTKLDTQAQIAWEGRLL